MLKELNTKYISFDINTGTNKIVEFFQHENTAKLVVNLKNNGTPFDLTGLTAVRVYIKKADNKIAFINGKITDISNGEVEFELTDNILAAYGKLVANIIIYEGEDQLKFNPTFTINCIKTVYDEDAIISSNEFSALKEALKLAQQGGVSTEELKNIIKGLITSGEVQIEAYDDTEIRNIIGSLSNLSTTDKSNLVNAINEVKDEIDNTVGTETLPTTSKTLKGAISEVFTSVSNGKKLIASAITDKGIITSNDATFQTMANNISSITTSGGGDTPVITTDPYRTGRTLVWEDDFNGNSVDNNSWNISLGYIGNNESQYYMNDSDNVYVENSNLILKAIRENVNGYKGETTQTFEWTSGKLESSKKKEFKYGRFEAKIKIPQTVGSFPAFWTLGNTYDYVYADDPFSSGNPANQGQPWSFCGELDIMEHKNGKEYITAGGIYNIGTGNLDIGRQNYNGTLDFNEYHIYAMEWTENKIEFYVDENRISSFTVTDDMTMFRMPHFILLNHAIGASGGTPPDSVNEYVMYVDWVRVYAPKTVTNKEISLNKTSTTIAVGDTEQLSVTYSSDYFVDGTTKWTSSNTSVATVYGGKIKGIASGKTTITATCGSYTATCTVTVGSVTTTTYTVTNNLTNITNSNSSSSVNGGSSYSATLTASSGYELSSVTVTMGGNDITSTAYSNGYISISSVTGNIVITANATQSTTTTYTVTNNLTNCSNNNSAISVEENSSYSATISANSGYELGTVTVTMGGNDISSSAVSGGIITISSVTGNIEITAVATTEEGVLLNFDATSQPSIDDTFTTTIATQSTDTAEVSYENGYLKIHDGSPGQKGSVLVKPKSLTVSGKMSYEAQMKIVTDYNSNEQDEEGIRFGIDDGSKGIYLYIHTNRGIKYCKGSSFSTPYVPQGTTTITSITSNTSFKVKIVIDFTNQTDAEIYYNDELIASVPYADWSSHQYVNKNTAFIMPRTATAYVKTITIKQL